MLIDDYILDPRTNASWDREDDERQRTNDSPRRITRNKKTARVRRDDGFNIVSPQHRSRRRQLPHKPRQGFSNLIRYHWDNFDHAQIVSRRSGVIPAALAQATELSAE